jgi:hypothetical protein
MSKDDVWQFIIGAIIVAIIYMLVRPGAPAAAAVQDVSTALAGLIKTATDYNISGNTSGQTQVT